MGAFRPRDGVYLHPLRGNAQRPVPPFPGAPVNFSDGQNAPKPCFLPQHAKIRRANSEAPLPRRGKQRRPRTLAAPPCPCGARQRRQTLVFAGGRPLLVGLPPSTPLPLHPKRNAARPPPARGAGARLHGAEGAGSRHCRLARCVTLCPPTGAKARCSSIKNAGLFCRSSSPVLSIYSIPAPAAFHRVEGASEMFRGEGFYEGSWCNWAAGRRCLLPHRRVPPCRDRASCARRETVVPCVRGLARLDFWAKLVYNGRRD